MELHLFAEHHGDVNEVVMLLCKDIVAILKLAVGIRELCVFLGQISQFMCRLVLE